ncbi:MAG: cytidylate kinase-like family protein [Clostridia bacterium]
MKKDKYVITIARQFGSLGRPIAQKMSEKLGIEFYDRDIVDEASKKLNLPVSVINEEEETAVVSLGIKHAFGRMAYPLGKGTTEKQDKIFETQETVIKFLVERDSCIVVGRCADFILSEHPNAMHIYIYAPYEARVKNSVEELGLEIEEAKRMIYEVDQARDSYHMHYAGFKPDDKNFKHIMVDSDYLGVEGTAEYLVDIIKKKFNLS